MLMPQYRPFANDDARKAKLTLADLMSMRSGLARDDNDPDSPGGEDRMQRQKDQPDWYRYRLDLPMLKEPGGRDAVYCSADLNLVGGVAETIAQTWNGDLFERHVAEPLGFATYHLNLMPTGSGYTGGGVYLRPRDALKLGQLYLAGGLWNGTRVVSRDWVDRRGLRDVPATGRRRRRQPPVRLRLARPPFRRRGGRTYREFAAEGNGGQFVMVFPELDMVVGVNGGKYGSSDWYRWGLQSVTRYFIPAAAHQQGDRP
jgi:CubicO group peptidase (beta-lactamase class C family)